MIAWLSRLLRRQPPRPIAADVLFDLTTADGLALLEKHRRAYAEKNIRDILDEIRRCVAASRKRRIAAARLASP